MRIAEDLLRRPDMLFIKDWYARTPSSGFWFCEYGDNFVGLISIDACVPDVNWQPGRAYTQAQRTKDIFKSAVIRHFYVAEKYRKALIQDDMLTHAVKTAFDGSSTVESVGIMPAVLSPYIDEALKKQGFAVRERAAKVGIMGWEHLEYELTREKWEKAQQG